MQSGNEIWSVNRIYLHKFFHEKSYAKSGGETIPSPFYKTYIWICQIEDYRITLKLSSRPLPFTSYKAVLKHRKKSGTSLPVSFPACFLKKNISLVIFYYMTKFHWLVAFTSY